MSKYDQYHNQNVIYNSQTKVTAHDTMTNNVPSGLGCLIVTLVVCAGLVAYWLISTGII